MPSPLWALDSTCKMVVVGGVEDMISELSVLLPGLPSTSSSPLITTYAGTSSPPPSLLPGQSVRGTGSVYAFFKALFGKDNRNN